MVRRRKNRAWFLFFVGLLWLWGCGSPSSDSTETEALVLESRMELKYAENFSVEYYADGYKILKTMDGTQLLLVPEGKEAPSLIPEDTTVLQQPVRDIYLVASSAMDSFSQLDGLDRISLSGQKAEGWYIEAAKEAMERGEILYAGKYNKPDYELIVSKKCALAIENRMITHSPQVVERLNDFGIPVVIEYSSYEKHPLGRVEWVKFFGALIDKEQEAQAIFDKQAALLEEISKAEKTGKTVAFFYVTSNGLILVRQSADYIPKMIELAGGEYIFKNLGEADSGRSTMNLQVEEFYDAAKDADYLIYNSSIDGGVASVEELLDKCQPLKDFKAVKEGKVWCTTNDMYQQSLSIGYLMKDMYEMLHDGEESQMKYLFLLP